MELQSTPHEDILICLICLETMQLPVMVSCFRCAGQQGFNCMRSSICLSCADSFLQLGKSPLERFSDSRGKVRCLICRETKVDATKLNLKSNSPYLLNHSLMSLMDALNIQATCSSCPSLTFLSQSLLLEHHLHTCPSAVISCKYEACCHTCVRTEMATHESTCPVGKSKCLNCSKLVEKEDLFKHMLYECRLRIVDCPICEKKVPLSSMVAHLKEHQAELQQQVSAQATGRSVARPAEKVPAAEATGAAVTPNPQVHPFTPAMTTTPVLITPVQAPPSLSPQPQTSQPRRQQSETSVIRDLLLSPTAALFTEVLGLSFPGNSRQPVPPRGSSASGGLSSQSLQHRNTAAIIPLTSLRIVDQGGGRGGGANADRNSAPSPPAPLFAQLPPGTSSSPSWIAAAAMAGAVAGVSSSSSSSSAARPSATPGASSHPRFVFHAGPSQASMSDSQLQYSGLGQASLSSSSSSSAHAQQQRMQIALLMQLRSQLQEQEARRRARREQALSDPSHEEEPSEIAGLGRQTEGPEAGSLDQPSISQDPLTSATQPWEEAGQDEGLDHLPHVGGHHQSRAGHGLNTTSSKVRSSMVILWTSQSGRMSLKRSLSDAALETNRREEIRIDELGRAV